MYLFMVIGPLAADFYRQAVEAHKCFDSGSICFELLKGLPAAFVALIIGLIAAGIAWRQSSVAKAKLKLDLFEERYAIFEQTWTIFSQVAKQGAEREYGLATPFNNFIPQAAFLFGPDIETYLRAAATRWAQLLAFQTLTDGSKGAPNSADVDRHQQLQQWFNTEADSGVKKKFAQYLDFAEWK